MYENRFIVWGIAVYKFATCPDAAQSRRRTGCAARALASPEPLRKYNLGFEPNAIQSSHNEVVYTRTSRSSAFVSICLYFVSQLTSDRIEFPRVRCRYHIQFVTVHSVSQGTLYILHTSVTCASVSVWWSTLSSTPWVLTLVSMPVSSGICLQTFSL